MIKTTRLDLINLLQETLPSLIIDAREKVKIDEDNDTIYSERDIDDLVMEYTKIIVSGLEEN